MASEEVATYGVTKRKVVADELDSKIEEIDRLGFTVLQSSFSDEMVDSLRNKLDAVYQNQVDDEGANALIKSNDVNIARCPLASDEVFIGVATHPLLMELCHRIFGDNYVLLQQNGIINIPEKDQYQKRWHRDLPYQHFVMEGSAKIAINALFCLDPFSIETGGTWVLPGSQKFGEFPSDNFVKNNEFPVDVPAGSILVMDAMCFHRSGHNTSKIIRRGVNHLIGLPMLVPQFDLPKLLPERLESDPFLNKYFGWRWNPKPDITSWRKIRQK